MFSSYLEAVLTKAVTRLLLHLAHAATGLLEVHIDDILVLHFELQDVRSFLLQDLTPTLANLRLSVCPWAGLSCRRIGTSISCVSAGYVWRSDPWLCPISWWA